MKRLLESAFGKGIAVTIVALLMLVPLARLRGLIEERVALREGAIDIVARGWGGRQILGGPVLEIPVTRRAADGQQGTRSWYVLPAATNLEVSLAAEKKPRRVGIYEVPVYLAHLHSTAQFDLPRELSKLSADDPSVRVHLDLARIILPIGDLRGVRDAAVSKGQAVVSGLEPSRAFPISTLAAPVDLGACREEGRCEFDATVNVAGTDSLHLLPLAQATRVHITGNWLNPGFTAGFLPAERTVSDAGFSARWQVLDLNRSYGTRWFQGDTSLADLEKSSFGVDLVQPVDIYQQVARAVKYAGLFIGLSLMTLFLFEFLIERPLHPVQYGLMGFALSVFYLLLLALAEQIGFLPAYVVAAAALCALIGIYLAGALRSNNAGLASAGIFGVVYALLYLLVTAEDYALLSGSLALFVLLASIMVVTRRLDWYKASA